MCSFCADRRFEVGGRHGAARHAMAQIGHDRVAGEQLERQLLKLLAAFHHVLWRIDMASGMEPHVHAAHDLAGAARRVVLLQGLDRELHVLGKAFRACACDNCRHRASG